jgi:hypothetical protein
MAKLPAAGPPLNTIGVANQIADADLQRFGSNRCAAFSLEEVRSLVNRMRASRRA